MGNTNLLEKTVAFREVRIYLSSGNAESDKDFAIHVHQPFICFMDSVMRGRFKEYSGDEVKGVNLVNLRLFTPQKMQELEKRAARAGGSIQLDDWKFMLNSLELESEIDPNEFSGVRTEKVDKAIEIFLRYAEKSELPQMKTLVSHTVESRNIELIKKSMEKADKRWKKFQEKYCGT